MVYSFYSIFCAVSIFHYSGFIYFMNFLNIKNITSVTLVLLLVSFPQILLSQTKVVGELIIAETTPSGNELSINVNGSRAESGRSIMSPSSIVTPANLNAKVILPKVGSVTVSPNSNLELSFDSSSISGNLNSGEFIIYADPKIAVNFSTPDGNITVPVSDGLNSFEVKIVGGKTTVYSLFGKTQFNDQAILAGEYYPKQANKDKADVKKSDGKSNSGLLILGIVGAVGAGALFALAGGGSSSSNNVSPTS